jgi:hypothetical protein
MNVNYSMQDIWIPQGIFEKIDAADSQFIFGVVAI